MSVNGNIAGLTYEISKTKKKKSALVKCENCPAMISNKFGKRFCTACSDIRYHEMRRNKQKNKAGK